MNSTPTPSHDKQPRDTPYWSQTSTLRVSKVPTGALISSRRTPVARPLQGFGQLWQKTFRIHLKEPCKPVKSFKCGKKTSQNSGRNGTTTIYH